MKLKEWHKRFLIRFAIGMGLYIFFLPLSLALLQSDLHFSLGVKYLIALLPVFPLFYAIGAVVSNARQQDELHQRIELEAVLMTALLTGAITFSIGLLEASELLPDIPYLLLVGPMMIGIWGFAKIFISRQYELEETDE